MKRLAVSFLISISLKSAAAAPTADWVDLSDNPKHESATSEPGGTNVIYSRSANEIKPVKIDKEEDKTIADTLPKNVVLDVKNLRSEDATTRKIFDTRKEYLPKIVREDKGESNRHIPKTGFTIDYSILLFDAIFSADIGAISTLLERGADINARHKPEGYTPLMFAVAKSQGLCAKYLIARGAKLDLIDFTGKTALHNAASAHDIDMVKLLLDSGARDDIVDASGKTPMDYLSESDRAFFMLYKARTIGELADALFVCSKSNNATCIKACIEKGVDANYQDSKGRTPLMIASVYGNLNAIRALLSSGADPLKVSNENATALDYAMLHNRASLLTFLDSAMIRYELAHDLPRPTTMFSMQYAKNTAPLPHEAAAEAGSIGAPTSVNEKSKPRRILPDAVSGI